MIKPKGELGSPKLAIHVWREDDLVDCAPYLITTRDLKKIIIHSWSGNLNLKVEKKLSGHFDHWSGIPPGASPPDAPTYASTQFWPSVVQTPALPLMGHTMCLLLDALAHTCTSEITCAGERDRSRRKSPKRQFCFIYFRSQEEVNEEYG